MDIQNIVGLWRGSCWERSLCFPMVQEWRIIFRVGPAETLCPSLGLKILEMTETAPDIQLLNEQVEKASRTTDLIRAEIGKTIIGQTHMIDKLLIGLLAIQSTLKSYHKIQIDRE